MHVHNNYVGVSLLCCKIWDVCWKFSQWLPGRWLCNIPQTHFNSTQSSSGEQFNKWRIFCSNLPRLSRPLLHSLSGPHIKTRRASNFTRLTFKEDVIIKHDSNFQEISVKYLTWGINEASTFNKKDKICHRHAKTEKSKEWMKFQGFADLCRNHDLEILKPKAFQISSARNLHAMS